MNGASNEGLTKELDARVTAVQDSFNKVQGLGVAIRRRLEVAGFRLEDGDPEMAADALAKSLGAPFWFDMLNKVISIRSAGKAPDEKAKR